MLLSRTLLFIGLAFVFVGTNAVPTLGINDTGEDDLFNLGDALKEDATKPPAVHPKMPDTPLDFDDDEAPAVPKNRNSDPVHPKMPDTHFDNDEAPAVPKNRNSDPDEFDLSVAIDGDDQYTPTKPSKPAYVPNEGDSDRQFGDTDLIDAAGGLKPVQPNPEDKDKGSNQGGGNGTITGLVTGLLLALGGGVSSYILYQKKKLCFGLGNSTEQNTKQENVQGQREDPQSYSTLLQSQPIGSN